MRIEILQLLEEIEGQHLTISFMIEDYQADATIDSTKIEDVQIGHILLSDQNNTSQEPIKIQIEQVENIEIDTHGSNTRCLITKDAEENNAIELFYSTPFYSEQFWSNGKLKYAGSLKYGKPHGQGKSYNKNGMLTYSGTWKYGVRHGSGTKYSEDNHILYEGQFQFNQYHGTGTYIFPNKKKYIGSFSYNKPDGQGEILAKEGFRLYQGGFKNGKKHGFGKEIDEYGEWEREGYWDQGTFLGDDEDAELELKNRKSQLVHDVVLKKAIISALLTRENQNFDKDNLTVKELERMYYLRPKPLKDGRKIHRIKDLSPLSYMIYANEIDLSEALHPGVFELPELPIENNVNILNLAHTNIDSIDWIKSYTHLENLDLTGTNVIDIRPLLHLTSLTHLKLPAHIHESDIVFLASQLESLTTVNDREISFEEKFDALKPGTLTYPTGNIGYEGTLIAGNKRYGKGILYAPDGSVMYRGEWFADKRHGTGTSYDNLGKMIYQGNFHNNMWHGYGKLYRQDNTISYEGYFYKNMQHGKGTAYHPNGKKMYEGDYDLGYWHGLGTVYEENGQISFSGAFKNGQMDR